ncbi:hypothetical protein V1264_004111 [Littorina saxatilis]|uniref:Uncharacterized protein n=1 Tax=Littorina saxatilis TaxID=31220 RepID=A0AAN9G6G2_9CAEN
MNRDAKENPTQSGLSHDLQLEIRDKNDMGCTTAAVTGDSGVDPAPLKNKANWTSKRQVNASIVAPPLIHHTVTPSHKHAQKYDWLPKFYFLRKQIAPKLPPIRGISLSSKEAGDVDLKVEKQADKEAGEDAVDSAGWHPKGKKTDTPVASKVDRLPSPAAKKKEEKEPKADKEEKDKDLPGGEKDGVFLTTRTIDCEYDTGNDVDGALIFDYEGSHSVDGVHASCSNETSGSHSVDATDGSMVTIVRVNSEIFSDSADAPSSSTDPRSKDWEPREAEAILSEIYDLGDDCICMNEDGCICCLSENVSPEEKMVRREQREKEKEAAQRKDLSPSEFNEEENSLDDTQLWSGGRIGHHKRRPEGGSTDLHFHQSNIHSAVDQIVATTFERRKNTKLSDRIICKRRFSPNRADTGVDPSSSAREGNFVTDSLVDGSEFTTNRLRLPGSRVDGPGLASNKLEERQSVHSEYATRSQGPPRATVSSTVDGCVASRSRTVDSSRVRGPSEDDEKPAADFASAVDSASDEIFLDSSCVDSSFDSSVLDGRPEVPTNSLTGDADMILKFRAVYSGKSITSSDVDDASPNTSSAVDESGVTHFSRAAEGLSRRCPRINVEFNTLSSSVDDDASTKSSQVDKEVPVKPSKSNPDIAMKSQAADSDISRKMPRLHTAVECESFSVDNEDDLSTAVDADNDTECPNIVDEVAPDILTEVAMQSPTHVEVAEDFSDVDAFLSRSSTVDNEELVDGNANTCTMQSAHKIRLSATSPQFYRATKVRETVHLPVLGDDPEQTAPLLEDNELSESDTTPESAEEHAPPKRSPPRKSHSDADAAQNSKTSPITHGVNVIDTVKLPASFPSLKATPCKPHGSRIPKPVAAKTMEKPTEHHHDTGNGDLSQSTNNNENVPGTDTDLKHSPFEDGNFSPGAGENITKPPTPCEENKGQQEVSEEGNENNSTKRYVNQMITFYSQRDAKVVTTIPPPSPLLRKKTGTPPPSLPAWNCSTYVEKPKKTIVKSPRLQSKRNCSLQSLIDSASSESSAHSLASEQTETSMERLTAFISNSLTEHNNSPNTQNRSHKRSSPRGGSTTPRQPFRPGGIQPIGEGENRRLLPAKNSARSHPDLRVPGRRVDVPVCYPSAQSDTTATVKSTVKTGANGEVTEGDSIKPSSLLPDRNYIYPHSVPTEAKDAHANTTERPVKTPDLPAGTTQDLSAVTTPGMPTLKLRILPTISPDEIVEEETGKNENTNSVSGCGKRAQHSSSSPSSVLPSGGSETFSRGLTLPKSICFDMRPQENEEQESAEEWYRGFKTQVSRNNSSSLANIPFYLPKCPSPDPPTGSKIPLPWRTRSPGRKIRPLGTMRNVWTPSKVLALARQPLPPLSQSRPVCPPARSTKGPVVSIFDFDEAKKDIISYRRRSTKLKRE